MSSAEMSSKTLQQTHPTGPAKLPGLLPPLMPEEDAYDSDPQSKRWGLVYIYIYIYIQGPAKHSKFFNRWIHKASYSIFNRTIGLLAVFISPSCITYQILSSIHPQKGCAHKHDSVMIFDVRLTHTLTHDCTFLIRSAGFQDIRRLYSLLMLVSICHMILIDGIDGIDTLF